MLQHTDPAGSLAAHWPFPGHSEMAQRMRDFDWSRSPLGPVPDWPHSLKAVVATLLECQLPMYLTWGPGLTQLYNDAYRAILGAKHPQALGRSTRQTWHEVWDTVGPMWEEVMAGHAIGYDDFKLTIERFGYPEDCYFNFSYSPVRDDQGRPAGVLVSFAETTRRVLAERRLRFLDELAQATRHASEPQEVMNLTAELLGRCLGVNRCAYAQVHADQDTFDLLGDYNDGVHSIVGRYRFADFGQEVLHLMRIDRPYVNEDVDRSPATAGTDLGAYRRTQIQSVICVPLHKNGRLVAAMAVHQAVPRRWTPGEIELVRTVVDRCWNSLERLRVQAALHDEARSLELLNRAGAALSAELDLRTLLQRVTDAATELTGAQVGACFYNSPDEPGEMPLLYALSGVPAEILTRLGRHPQSTLLMAPTLQGGEAVRLDDVLEDPRYGRSAPHYGMPGDHLPVRSYLAVPVVARSGEVLGSLLFGHADVRVFTERSERLALGIASQAAIAIDNARLYALAQQAAHERHLLLESERAARLEAERASQVKDEFLATLSHELRTPLSAISGWAHILRRKLDAIPPELRKGVEVIDRSTRTQVQLIDDLLDMSRITSGKLALDLQPISPVGFVQAALDVIAPGMRDAGVALEVAIDDAGVVLGDAGRLQQVVWNLLSNAIKFTPRGGRVQVRLHAEQTQAVIAVSDTGVGIRPAFLPHLFERFRQADGSITRQFGGLGLGLSIVRRLVDLHGGSVAVHSEGEGAGATFTVRLPLRQTPVTPQAWGPPAAPASSAAGAWSGGLAGLRVLVVDDDADAQELLQRMLGEAGAAVQTAGSADAALAALSHGGFDLLVSDIGMPGTDGYQLLRRVRALPAQHGDLPAIALTAFARPQDKQRALDAGFELHLPKPVDPEALLAAVARLCRPPGSSESPGA